MKKILITGANSYIGTSFETYMKQWHDEYQVDTVDMIDGSWRQKDFSGYDAIFHVAGVAHIKENKKNRELYYIVNRDLTVETARKAKNDGVKQLIFLSSMSVYGMNTGIITRETIPTPKTHYGISKLEAEYKLKELADGGFIVSILRPPMVYGKGCKGNYQTLSKWAKRLPLFPDIKNQRSMIYIGSLVYFIKKLIDEATVYNIYFPQNAEYICTSDMIKMIAKVNNHNIIFLKLFNPLIKLLSGTTLIKKIFGSLIYEDKSDQIDYELYKSIIETEK